MSISSGRPRRLRSLAGLATLAAGFQLASAMLPSSASAQATTNCADIQKFLLDRKAIAAKLTPAKGQKLDAGLACSNFGKLVTNGSSLIKWVDTNKDWCQIPDSFVTGIKEDNGRAVTIRAKACGVAAKQAQMEKQAKQGGGGGENSGLLGGPGLEGSSKLPSGAL